MISLINSPTGKSTIRQCAGGLGFGSNEESIFPPIDLMYFASEIRKEQDVAILDCDAQSIPKTRALELIAESDGAIINVSLPTIHEDMDFIRAASDVTNVLPQTSITHKPILEQIFEDTGVNRIIVGKPITDINRILRGEDTSVAKYVNGRLRLDKVVYFPAFDKLALPARDLIDSTLYFYNSLGKPSTVIYTGLGCPHPCRFYCPYPSGEGTIWISRSAQGIFSEINDAMKTGSNSFYFKDTLFTSDRARVMDLSRLLVANQAKIRWWCETRADQLDEQLMESMRESGLAGLNLGIESGDEVVRRTKTKNGLSYSKIDAVIRSADKLGIKYAFLVMVGHPAETPETTQATLDIVKRYHPFEVGICYATPYPGTGLYTLAESKGWLVDRDLSHYDGRTPVMRTDNMSIADMKLFYNQLNQMRTRR